MESSQNPLKEYLTVFVSFLSFVTTLGCLITFIIRKDLHTLGFRLVIGLAMSNFILAFSHFLTIFHLWAIDALDYNILCNIQSALLNFSQLASVIWIAALSWIMYVNIMIRRRNTMRRARDYYIFTFGLAATATVGPIIADQFQETQPLCWFKLDFAMPNVLQFGLAAVELYVPLWMTIILTTFAIRRVANFIQANVSGELSNVASRLKYYPLALLTIWLIPSLQIFISLISQKNIDWLEDVSVVLQCSQGLLYSIIFFKSESVQFRFRSRVSSVNTIEESIKARGSTMDMALETINYMESVEFQLGQLGMNGI